MEIEYNSLNVFTATSSEDLSQITLGANTTNEFIFIKSYSSMLKLPHMDKLYISSNNLIRAV